MHSYSQRPRIASVALPPSLPTRRQVAPVPLRSSRSVVSPRPSVRSVSSGRRPHQAKRPPVTIWQRLRRWVRQCLRWLLPQLATPPRPSRSLRALPTAQRKSEPSRPALPPARLQPSPSLLRNTYIPTRSGRASSSALVIVAETAPRRRLPWLLGVMLATTSFLATALVVLVANLTLRLFQQGSRPSPVVAEPSPAASAPPLPVSYQVRRLRQAIIAQESGGEHQLINASGSGAMGLGQIMPENLPSWSHEVLGRELSFQEFLNRPDIQVQIIDHKLEEYWHKAHLQANGNIDETVMRVAAWWYSGNPEQFRSTTPEYWGGDSYPSVAEYSTSVLGYFNRTRPTI